MTGNDVEQAVQSILQDTARGHWALTDLLQWIYEAELAHAQHAPRAVTQTLNLSLTTGQHAQALDADYSALLDITQNMGADGATVGKPITFAGFDRLRAARPNWRKDRGSSVRHFMRDERDARTYYVWPAPSGTLKVESIVMVQPTKATALADVLTVADEYVTSMADYVLHRAFAQDSEDASNANLSMLHMSSFANRLGVKLQNWKAMGPTRNSGESPTYPAAEKNAT